MNSIIDNEIEINKKFAEDHNLSAEMLERKAEEIYQELNPDDFESDDARRIRSLRRARGSMRMLARNMLNAENGMLVFRFRDFAFDRDQYNASMNQLSKVGQEEAYKKKFVDKEGNPVYRYGAKTGQRILDPKANGGAVGYLYEKNKDGEETIKVKYFAISEDRVEDTIPVCQYGAISARVGKSPRKNFKYSKDKMMWYNAGAIDEVHKAPYSEEEIAIILDDWNKAFTDKNGKILIEQVATEMDLYDFAFEHSSIKNPKDYQYDFCCIPCVISDITTPKTIYENVGVVIEFTDHTTNEVSTITSYLHPSHIKGLAISVGATGIACLQSYKYKDKTTGEEKIGWHLGGFLQVQDDVDLSAFFGDNNNEEV